MGVIHEDGGSCGGLANKLQAAANPA